MRALRSPQAGSAKTSGTTRVGFPVWAWTMRRIARAAVRCSFVVSVTGMPVVAPSTALMRAMAALMRASWTHRYTVAWK